MTSPMLTKFQISEGYPVKNPNWQEADQLAIYTTRSGSWTRDNREQIQIAAGWTIWTWDLQISNPAT